MWLSINCHLAVSKTSLGYDLFYIAQQVTFRFVVSKHTWLCYVCCFCWTKHERDVFQGHHAAFFFNHTKKRKTRPNQQRKNGGRRKLNCFPSYVSPWFWFFYWSSDIMMLFFFFLAGYIILSGRFKGICALQTCSPFFFQWNVFINKLRGGWENVHFLWFMAS